MRYSHSAITHHIIQQIYLRGVKAVRTPSPHATDLIAASAAARLKTSKAKPAYHYQLITKQDPMELGKYSGAIMSDGRM
jgi:hypothetical protein